jgi:preprotein translocase subunit SecB
MSFYFENFMSQQPSVSANPFSVVAQYVKDVSFENLLMGNPNPPSIDKEPEILISADVNNTQSQSTPGAYEVSLTVNAMAQHEGHKIFIAEVTSVAVIVFEEEFVKEFADYVDPTLCIEIPFYLFFEIRNLIANLSNMGGYPPIFVRPIDFGAMYQEKMQLSTMTKQ